MKNIFKGKKKETKKKETKKESPVLSEHSSTKTQTQKGAELSKEEQDFLNGQLTPQEKVVMIKAKEGKLSLSFREELLKKQAERKQKHYARQQRESEGEGS